MTPVEQFRVFVVRRVLVELGLFSTAAEDIVVGTAVHESGGLRYFEQMTGRDDVKLGPAIGFFQIEPATHDDLYANFLEYRYPLLTKLRSMVAHWPSRHEQLMNPFYGAAVCRLIYYRAKDPLPMAGDIDGYAAYWKKYYNTPLGKGTTAQWVAAYKMAGS